MQFGRSLKRLSGWESRELHCLLFGQLPGAEFGEMLGKLPGKQLHRSLSG